MQLGVYLDTVENSYLNYCIFKTLNELQVVIPCNVFCLRPSKPFFEYRFGIYTPSPFDGLCIATSVETAQLIRDKEKAWFYVWDLEWLRREVDMSLYQIPLLTRNQVMADEILKTTGQSARIIGDFDTTHIKNLWRSYIPDLYSSMNW